jgi:IS30 family transposase
MRNYTRLTIEDRKHIERWFDEGLSISEIARRLGRSKNTISREIRLRKVKFIHESGKWERREKPRAIEKKWTYSAEAAEDMARKEKKKKKKPIKLKNCARLLEYVSGKLREGLKPDVISGRIKLDCPLDIEMRISSEAIYRYIYSNIREGLFEYLDKPRKRRKKRSSRPSKRKLIKERVSIAHRGKKAKNRKEIGHFEADSVIGKTGGSKKVMQTLVDRKSRLMLASVSNDKTAEETLRNLLLMFKDIPKGAAKTVTFDNGSEFSLHYMLAKHVGAKTYFADPYCSWQRGTNERHNRMLRKFFPKKTDFNNVSSEELKEAVDYWNNLPRKILGYLTPMEVWEREVLKDPPKIAA